MTFARLEPDRECLRTLRRQETGVEAFREFVERYLTFVYSSAMRRLRDEGKAVEATHAVFLVLLRRGRKLRLKTVVAEWLFDLTAVACRRLARRRFWQRWFRRSEEMNAASQRSGDAPAERLWERVSAGLDQAIDRLRPADRRAVLLSVLLNTDVSSAAIILRTKERRLQRRQARGLKKLAKWLRRKADRIDPDALKEACCANAFRYAAPAGLRDRLFAVAAERSRPKDKLARRLLRKLAWSRWRRRVTLGGATAVFLLAATIATAWRIDAKTGHSRGIALWLELAVRLEAMKVPGLAEPARPWPGSDASPRRDARGVRGAGDLYQTTNIWLAHLKFTPEQWKEFQPERIAPLAHFLQPGGTVLLRNPEAQRSGLAGVLGFDFHWTHADLELGSARFTNVATRMKGNGTYLASLWGRKQAFKIDLNKFVKGQKLGGLDELTFNNLVVDQTYLSDTLAYEYFREAGVPAPRTAFAYVTRSIAGKFDRKPVGLYVMVESVDEAFAADRFGSKKAPIFKPVTYKLFEDIGGEWTAYAGIYDLKTEATAEQEQRVIAFARLVSHAADAEFAARVGEFLDLEAFARFLAGQVMLSNYDSILSNGQNYHVYLDPRSNKFGFIPWDLDLAWGGFFLLATTQERERASIWHPWVGENRFIERVMKVVAFRALYRAQLERQLADQFVPERIFRRIDEVAAVIREPISAESGYRLKNFEHAITSDWQEKPAQHGLHGEQRPVHQIKRFVIKRAQSVRDQLNGKTQGMILRR